MKRTEAETYRPGDVVIVQDIPARTDRKDGTKLGTRIAKIRGALEGGRFRVSLRMGNLGSSSFGCRFSPQRREIDAGQIVRLASSREITVGSVSVIVPLAVAS